jgi:hypothetical protein
VAGVVVDGATVGAVGAGGAVVEARGEHGVDLGGVTEGVVSGGLENRMTIETCSRGWDGKIDLQAAILLKVTRRQSLGQIVRMLRSRNSSERQESGYREVHDCRLEAENSEEIVMTTLTERTNVCVRSKISTITKEIPPASYRLSALLPPRPSLNKASCVDACSVLSLAYHERSSRMQEHAAELHIPILNGCHCCVRRS